MLQSIRVIDFTFYLPGPFATMRLAKLGAEVIKIEPLTGDLARNMGVQKNGIGLLFDENNKNKKSIALNLKHREGQQIALELIKSADVVVEGYRPGVAKRLGIDYESVKEINKRIVYCSISGFGQEGAYSRLGSHDLNYMAMSGALAQLKDRCGAPIHPTNTFADLISSLGVNEAILSGLLQSERKGKGCYIDLSMTELMTSFMLNHVSLYEEVGTEYGVPHLGGAIVSYQIYETKDGRFVSIAALEEKFWENFCIAIGREDLIEAHYSPAVDGNKTFEEIKAIFASKTWKQWTEFGLKVDCCLTPVLETKDIANAIKAEDASYPKTSHPLSIFNDNQGTVPQLGEHTEEILTNILHASKEQIESWRKNGVIL